MLDAYDFLPRNDGDSADDKKEGIICRKSKFKMHPVKWTHELGVSATDNHGLEGRERIYKMADIGGGLP